MQSVLWKPMEPQCGTVTVDDPSHRDELLIRLGKLRLTLTYPGWQEDFFHAERAVLTNPQDLEDMHLFKLEEKQRMFNGNRSHERLVKLDSHTFTYPGWQLDARKLEEYHVIHKSGCCFEDALQVMVNKENMFTGDRSHPILVKLDRIRNALSYPGWEYDFVTAEKSHLTHPDGLQEHYIFKLVEKQRMFYGDRSHPRLQRLDSYAFDYPGWEMDKRFAEEEHVIHKKSPWFEQILQTMKYRQRLFDSVHRRRNGKVVANESVDATTKNEGESQTNANPCVICMSEPKSHAFLPCGHLCACEICAFEAFGRTGDCPICRQEANSVAQIFLT